MGYFSHFKKLDWKMIGAVLALCAIGLLTLYSTNYGKPSLIFFEKQVVFILIGLAIMFFFSYFDPGIFKNRGSLVIVIYLIGLSLLVLVLFLSKQIRGTHSWFNVADFGFQPVEMIKLVVILVLAKYFSFRHVEMYRARHVIASAIYIGLPATLILLQPDLGSTLILGAIWIGLVVLAGIKLRHLILVLIGIAIIFSLAWFGALKPYQKDRILTFLNPQRDPFGASYNLIQSKIAIGAGGIFGRGLGQGVQGRLDFLPEKHTDFIFSAFAEEWGFIGVIFLLALYGLLFYRLVKMSLHSQNNFSRIFCAGVCLMIFSELFINLSVAMGLLPITGISLPFISAGGSGILFHFVAIGIVQGFVVHTREHF